MDNQLALVKSDPDQADTPSRMQSDQHHQGPSTSTCVSIATISSGFEKGDFLVREEKGQRV